MIASSSDSDDMCGSSIRMTAALFPASKRLCAEDPLVCGETSPEALISKMTLVPSRSTFALFIV
ncbi:MAG: hypothetical protein BWX71_02627 [Deltaproteobacteria bacterium ADurb.Bin072]|nr:MAG: hypothetical protein BWX71_02627 [Deltaproteobacteria bacterium ADurb.Bin072]